MDGNKNQKGGSHGHGSPPPRSPRYHGGVDLQPDGTLASEGGYAPQQRGLDKFAYITVENARCVDPTGNIQIIKVMPGQNPVLRTRQAVLEETEEARNLEEAQKMTEEEKKKQDEKRDSDHERRPKKDSSSPRSRSRSRSPRASTSN